MRRYLVLVAFPLVVGCPSASKPPPPSVSIESDAASRSVPVASSVPSASATATATVDAGLHIALGASAKVSSDVTYAVDGTSLHVRVEKAQRANLVGGGHAWGANLIVTDGNERTELPLVGPDRPPGKWHGYRFELEFVVPTSLRITRE